MIGIGFQVTYTKQVNFKRRWHGASLRPATVRTGKFELGLP